VQVNPLIYITMEASQSQVKLSLKKINNRNKNYFYADYPLQILIKYILKSRLKLILTIHK